MQRRLVQSACQTQTHSCSMYCCKPTKRKEVAEDGTVTFAVTTRSCQFDFHPVNGNGATLLAETEIRAFEVTDLLPGLEGGAVAWIDPPEADRCQVTSDEARNPTSPTTHQFVELIVHDVLTQALPAPDTRLVCIRAGGTHTSAGGDRHTPAAIGVRAEMLRSGDISQYLREMQRRLSIGATLSISTTRVPDT
jgi:hypothetical protein